MPLRAVLFDFDGTLVDTLDDIAEAMNHDLLDDLAARDVPMAVLSNKPHQATVWMVEQLLGDWDFARVFGESDEVPRKPDPAGALRISSELGIDPAGWLYLGDTKTDMQTAAAAGMMPVGALWGFRDRGELVAHGARVLVERPGEVVGLLEG